MQTNKKKTKIENKRVRVSALIAFITCILFACFNGFIGFYYKSIFNVAMFIYYVIFVIITLIILIRFYKKAHMSINKLYFWSNIVLIVIDTSLIIPLTLMVNHTNIINLPIWICIVFSLYTIYKIVYAILGYALHRKNNNLLFKQLKTIKLIDACLALLALANIFILTFSKDTVSNVAAWSFFGCGIALIVGIIIFTSISFYKGLALIKDDKHYKYIEQDQD